MSRVISAYDGPLDSLITSAHIHASHWCSGPECNMLEMSIGISTVLLLSVFDRIYLYMSGFGARRDSPGRPRRLTTAERAPAWHRLARALEAVGFCAGRALLRRNRPTFPKNCLPGTSPSRCPDPVPRCSPYVASWPVTNLVHRRYCFADLTARYGSAEARSGGRSFCRRTGHAETNSPR